MLLIPYGIMEQKGTGHVCVCVCVCVCVWQLNSSGSDCKESACNAGDPGLIPGSVRKIPWRRKWQPTPVFFPGEAHGQRKLEGYSPWDCKEST